jgi:hypothetical protein
METRLIYPNVAQFLIDVGNNPMQTFRSTELIGFTPDQGLRGQVYTRNYKGKKFSENETLPPNLVFIQKTVLFQPEPPMQSKLGSFVLVNGDLPAIIAHGITEVIQTAQVTFPYDGHLRWRTSAPHNDKLTGYLTHNATMRIDPTQFDLDSVAIDMQMVRIAGKYHFHTLTRKGTVYHGIINPDDITFNKLPQLKTIRDGVNCILTAPQQNQTILVIYGTDQGLFVNDDRLFGTEDMKVIDLVVDSENPRIFFRTFDGQIYAMPVDQTFTVKGPPVKINDVIKPSEQLFAGPAVSINNQPALLAIDWNQNNNGLTYDKRTINVPYLQA